MSIPTQNLDAVRQRLFNEMIAGLASQGFKSSSFYRGKDGTRCAAGWIIPDSVYRPYLELTPVEHFPGDVIDEIIGEHRPENRKYIVSFVTNIDALSAVYDGEELEERLRYIAENRGLAFPEKFKRTDYSNARIVEWNKDEATIVASRNDKEDRLFIYAGETYVRSVSVDDLPALNARIVSEFPQPSLEDIVGDAPAFFFTHKDNGACIAFKNKGGKWGVDYLASIEHRPGRGPFEVVQVRWPKHYRAVFRRSHAPEHVSVPRDLYPLVERFLADRRRQS